MGKAEATALRIVTAAAKRFATHGFDATTIAQVAQDADVATGTVLLHFGSKSQLATAAFASEIQQAVRVAAAGAQPGDAVSELTHIAESLYRWYSDHQSMRSTLLREALFSDGPWAARYNETVEATAALFGEIIARHQQADTLDRALDTQLLAQGTLADYLLVLIQGLRGSFADAAEQTERFRSLTAQRLRVS